MIYRNWIIYYIEGIRALDEEVELGREQGNSFTKIPSLFKRVSSLFYKGISRKEFYEKNIAEHHSFVVADEKPNNEERQAQSFCDEERDYSLFCSENVNSQCMVCFENPSNAVVLPCGHGGLCHPCALVLKRDNKKCHMCRLIIGRIVKVKQDSQIAYIDSHSS